MGFMLCVFACLDKTVVCHQWTISKDGPRTHSTITSQHPEAQLFVSKIGNIPNQNNGTLHHNSIINGHTLRQPEIASYVEYDHFERPIHGTQ